MAKNKRQRAKKMAAGGASAAKIERKTGVSSKAANKFVAKAAAPAPSRPAPAPAPTPAPAARTTPKIKGVKQGLRIAGAGGISGGELKTIRKATGMSDDKLIRRLDKVNKKLKGQDKTGISINAGAVNKIIKRGVKQRSKDPFGATNFGTGRLGMTIAGMMGDPGSAGRYVKGQLVGAREAVEPTLLAGGMQIRPGGRERVQGFGKQYELPERFKPKDEVVDDTTTDTTDTTDTVDTTTTTETVEPVIPEPEPVDTSLSSGAGGLDLASWATGFRRARSARQRAGRKAQGTGSMKNLKFKQQFT